MRVSSTPNTSPASTNVKNSRTGPRPEARRAMRSLPARTRSAMQLPSRKRDFVGREHLFDDRGRVEHEPHALIAELRRAGETAHHRERTSERLDHDVLLTEQAVHHQAEPAVADG